jgi:rhodanese-related sulfurtransferase
MVNKKGKKIVKKSFPIWGWILIALGIIAIVGTIVLLTSHTSNSLASEVTVDQAVKLQNKGAFILDVREPSEWAEAHIAGATLIPLGELPNRMNELPKDKIIVVVCRTGHRSAQGRDILLQAGFKTVTSIAGGITQWQSQGLPLVSGN